MPDETSESVTQALASERLLHPATRPLTDASIIGKTLLTRPTTPFPVRHDLTLTPIVTENHWTTYETHRIEIEAGFRVPPDQARAMVTALRQRPTLTMFFASTPTAVVGAIGYFPLADPRYARLQEVDVFPAWRGRGYGDALLAAAFDQVRALGVSTVIVGADEDDWPLGWYRRRGFSAAVRVPLTR